MNTNRPNEFMIRSRALWAAFLARAGAEGAGALPNATLALAGALVVTASPRLGSEGVRLFVLGVGLVLIGTALLRGAARLMAMQSGAKGVGGDLPGVIENDPMATVVSGPTGQIRLQNAAAHAFFGTPAQGRAGQVAALLAGFTASPAPLVARLAARALAQGQCSEELPVRGQTLRIAIIADVQKQTLVWRFDLGAENAGRAMGAEAISLPMLTANQAGVVLFSNMALRQLLGGARPKSLDEALGQGPIRSGEETMIDTPAGRQSVLLVELPTGGPRREIYLLPMPAASAIGGANGADLNDIPVALALFAPDGALQNMNFAAREILGELPAEVRFFHEIFDALGRPASDWLADVMEERLPTNSQVLRLSRSATETPVFVQVTLRRMVQNARPAILAVIQDASALKTLEAQFVQSQKMQAIGQLAGGIAHDFNNLLTAISGNTDLLLLRHAGDDPSYPDLMQIRQNANRAAALVAQLLAFSRKQNLQPEYLDMQDVFSDLTHLLNRLVGEKLRLVLQHGAGLGTIRADRRQLEQVIVNLVVNARDAMPAGGSITLTTESVHLPEDLHRDRAVVPAGDYAKINISDTGIGIPEDLRQKIFEPFFTTKKAGEGTGLGLSTAYGIVKQSGGFIFVESAVGKGTTFTLYFPLHARPVANKPAPTAPQVIRQGEGVVLLVEDEAPVRAFAARALRLRGYTVLEAATGEEALALLRDGGLQVDLFISDVIMPGLDGPTWVREAQITRPDVPVIFVSGYAEDVMSEHQARIAHATFLPKPFSLGDLTLAVQEKLGLRAA